MGLSDKEDCFLQEGEVIIRIPRELMISPETVKTHPVFSDIIRQHKRLLYREDPLLAVFLMYEESLGSASFWYPYLQILPEVNNVASWEAAEVEELQDSLLAEKARSRKRSLWSMYNNIFEVLFAEHSNHFVPCGVSPLFCCGSLHLRAHFDLLSHAQNIFKREIFTFQRFTFYWNAVQARAFGRYLPWTALVPFADCLNHQNVKTKYDFNIDENGAFRLYALTPGGIAPGSEVYNCYGDRSNTHLLLEYGFLLDNNPHEYERVKFEILIEDPHYSEKQSMLTQWMLPTQTVFPDNFHETALIFQRVKCLDSTEDIRKVLTKLEDLQARDRQEQETVTSLNHTDDECSSTTRSTRYKPEWTRNDRISVDNERRALTSLIEVYAAALRSFPTTLQEDLQVQSTLLSASQETVSWERQLMAVKYRIQRKQIVLRQAELAREKVEQLDREGIGTPTVVSLLDNQDEGETVSGGLLPSLAAVEEDVAAERSSLVFPDIVHEDKKQSQVREAATAVSDCELSTLNSSSRAKTVTSA